MRMHKLFSHGHHDHRGHPFGFLFGYGEVRDGGGHHTRHNAGREPISGRGDGDVFGDRRELGGGGRHSRRRMFGHGDLKLLLLALIEQQPRHGYELIRLIEEMFHGHYSPSPGAIYPTLTMLEEMGHAEVSAQQGGRKLYAITGMGRDYLEAHRDEVDAMMARTEHSAKMAAKMSAPDAVRKAMHALKHALLICGADWSKVEAQRVAVIIERAASEIVAGRNHD
jgi:DNA-binding PadR family transcriptional regulator